ncbi:hypothetical protein GQ53DRAFT_864932 [Thozetella sp. PMI_491]|nr:hypothetical protein GQ53DRAFT_864932 [Thozetella sp. PMI_491]
MASARGNKAAAFHSHGSSSSSSNGPPPSASSRSSVSYGSQYDIDAYGYDEPYRADHTTSRKGNKNIVGHHHRHRSSNLRPKRPRYQSGGSGSGTAGRPQHISPPHFDPHSGKDSHYWVDWLLSRTWTETVTVKKNNHSQPERNLRKPKVLGVPKAAL